MRRLRLVPMAGFAMLAGAARLEAQWQLMGDVGLSHLQQTGIPTGGAGTIGLTFDAAATRAWVESSLLAARATQDRWTGQGLVAGTLVGPSASAPRWQLDAVASAFGQSNAPSTTSGELSARARAGSAARGGAIGAAGGLTARSGTSSPTWRGLVDAWITSNAERFSASGALTSAPVIGVGPPSTPTPRVRYLDLLAGWRHDVGGFSIGTSVGYRNGFADVESGTWAAGDATMWVASRAAVVIGAGTALPDAVRGTPRSTYVTAALRLSARPHVRITFGNTPKMGIRVRLASAADGAKRIEIIAQNASRVELRGDFTDWQPVQLERVGNAFRLELPIVAGLHRIAIRVDDGEWTAPANLPRADDGLGGTVGLITVP